MFTGIVSAMSPVLSLGRRASGALLAVERPPSWEDVTAGESVSVSGVCLTALPGTRDDPLRFDLSPDLEPIEADLSSLNPAETIRVVEDYKPLDIEAASMGLLLLIYIVVGIAWGLGRWAPRAEVLRPATRP